MPPLDKYASANASALRHLEPPADTFGLQDAGRLFDLPRVAQYPSAGNSILLRGVAVRERVLNRRPGRWQKRRPTSASL